MSDQWQGGTDDSTEPAHPAHPVAPDPETPIPAAPAEAPIPDPYYGGDSDFDEVLGLCLVACRHLLQEIRAEHEL